jgi:catechol 2,3-dioxygenase-like lactoylglutathione lyase family enzyme
MEQRTIPDLRLNHTMLLTPDPADLATFYKKALGMEVTQHGDMQICKGSDRCIVLGEGKTKTLGFAAYACKNDEELAHLRDKISASGGEIEKSPSPVFDDNAFSICDPDGNRFVFGVFPQNNNFPANEGLPGRLQHVAFASDEPEKLLAFYTDTLGFLLADRVEDEDNVLRASFFNTDSEHHSLAIFTAGEKRLDHHCFEAVEWNRIRDWADYLAQYEIPLQWGPGRHGPGNNLFFMIRDPEGNWLEISAELEIITLDRPIGLWEHAEKTLNSWGQALLRS